MRWLITEKCDYLVTADTREEAEEVFADHGPGDVESGFGVEFVSVSGRLVEPANMPGEGA